MKIFFDEDTGGGVPKALRALGVRNLTVEWPRPDSSAPIKKGTYDEVWIRWAAQQGFLIFSCNIEIWKAEAQRNVLLNSRGPTVFLTTGQEKKFEVLRLVLNQWGWLEEVWSSRLRPIVYRLTIRGAKVRLHP